MNNDLKQLIEALIEVEVQMNLYYQALMDFLPKHKENWEKLSKQEYAHAKVLARVRHEMQKSPEQYAAGKHTLGAARMIIKDSSEMIEKVIRREVNPRYAVSFIADIEKSAVESNLHEAIRTDNVEIRNLLNRIGKETDGHRNLLQSIEV